MKTYDLGDYIKRNNKTMYYQTVNTSPDVKSIKSGDEYEIVSRKKAAISEVIKIKSVLAGICYDVSAVDLKDFFEPIDSLTVVAVCEEDTEDFVETKPCTCDSHDLLLYGCRCGATKGNLDARYEKYLQKLMGPKMGQE